MVTATAPIRAWDGYEGPRGRGIRAECDHVGRSVKAQFKYADKIGAKTVLILGEDEQKRGIVKIRDMQTSTESEMPQDQILKFFE